MQEKLQKLIAAAGITSRRKAEEMILDGRVCVNDVVAVLGQRADPTVDTITVDGTVLGKQEQFIYIMLNKPRGYVTTLKDEKHRHTVAELVQCGTRVYPVGRLDMDSEGLLLMTNDGLLANKLMHPSHNIDKTYLVSVTGYSEQGFVRLSKPMELDGYRLKRPKLALLSTDGRNARFQITIHEGRNRQIRRMAEICGMKVTALKRIQEGSLKLGALKTGEWRFLTEDELCALDVE